MNKASGIEAFDQLLSQPPGNYSLVIDVESGKALAAERCERGEKNFVLIEDSSLATMRQFALSYPKNSPIKSRVDAMLLGYFADGTIGRLKQKWFKSCDENLEAVKEKQDHAGRQQPTPFGNKLSVANPPTFNNQHFF